LVSGLIVCSQPALIRAQDVGLAEQGTARNVDMNDTAGRLHENKPALMPSRISKHGLAGRCRCIQALLMEEQIDLERMQFGYDADKVFQWSAKAIDARGHDNVELAPRRIPAKGINRWPLVANCPMAPRTT
jgi:hypothetical protein